MTDEPRVTVTYVPSKAAHARAGVLSYIVANGGRHEPATLWPWPDPICPLCTYESTDVLAGVAWPCPEVEESTE